MHSFAQCYISLLFLIYSGSNPIKIERGKVKPVIVYSIALPVINSSPNLILTYCQRTRIKDIIFFKGLCELLVDSGVGRVNGVLHNRCGLVHLLELRLKRVRGRVGTHV